MSSPSPPLGTVNFRVLPSINIPYWLLGISTTIACACDNPLKLVFDHVDKKLVTSPDIVGILKEEYRLENALPLDGLRCIIVNGNVAPLIKFHPVPPDVLL